jgi:hypothetical protein
MSTSLKFPQPKDPADEAWYGIPFPVTIVSVNEVTASESKPTALTGVGAFTTPGDALSSPLTVSNGVVGVDTKTAMMWVQGGVPGRSYALRADVTDSEGNNLNRSAILTVTGR